MTGLKELGVRELNYKFVFKADCVSLQSDYSSSNSGFIKYDDTDFDNFTAAERDEIARMKEIGGQEMFRKMS